jgi:4-hydroxy-4-methyl-2-oxoglutarate aldolase
MAPSTPQRQFLPLFPENAMTDTTLARKLETFKRIGTATVHEAQAQRGYVDREIVPLDRASRMAGTAYTVDGRAGDNLVIHYAISRAMPGDVIVVDYKGYMRAAAIGDIMAFAAKARGIAGIVIDGATRDAAQIVELGFPVFSRGLCITGPTKAQGGQVGVPVVVGGCTIRPGDIVVGDSDGLVVVRAEDLDATLRAAEERDAKEAAVREQLATGVTTVSVMGLADKLRDHGLH